MTPVKPGYDLNHAANALRKSFAPDNNHNTNWDVSGLFQYKWNKFDE
jgi:hypothetical protein